MSNQTENLGGIAGWATDLMETMGAPGAGLAIALENLFPPLPSEIILPLAGFAASQGDLSLWAVLVWTTIGSVVGALALYGLGAWLGRDRLLAAADRMPLMKVADIERTERWFARHGRKAVFFGRMVPVFRSLVSVPAGLSGGPSRTDGAQGRMPLGQFLALTTLGSGIWNAAFVLAGYQLGEDWHRVSDAVGLYSRAILIAVAVGLLAFVVYRVARPGRGNRRRAR